MLPAVWEAIRPYFTDVPGNPASSHRDGQKARQALEDAREHTAALLGADADEVIFTSGATEANNLALFGLAGEPPGHLVVSPIEHPSVIEPVGQLARRGFRVDRLPVNSAGVGGTGRAPSRWRWWSAWRRRSSWPSARARRAGKKCSGCGNCF